MFHADVTLVVALVVIGIVAVALVSAMSAKRKISQEGQHSDPSLADDYDKRAKKEKADWLTRLTKAKHLLTGKNWRDSDGKEDFVSAVYGRVPEYLFYVLGTAVPTQQEKSFLFY